MCTLGVSISKIKLGYALYQYQTDFVIVELSYYVARLAFVTFTITSTSRSFDDIIGWHQR